MKRMMVIGLVAASFGGPAMGQSSDIRDVIGRQIEAFRADDFARAFEFASPGIRQVFRTPENFRRMVTEGYPMVYRPGEVTYLDLREVDGRQFQTVMIRDAEGRIHMLEYQMIRGEDGAWRIDGVRFLPQPEVGA